MSDSAPTPAAHERSAELLNKLEEEEREKKERTAGAFARKKMVNRMPL